MTYYEQSEYHILVFKILFYSANTIHHFSLHCVNVPTHYSVVPGNARMEFCRDWIRLNLWAGFFFYHEKRSTQYKTRDWEKKSYLVNKKNMSRSSTPLWQICLSTFWSSWGALVFYRERGAGRQPEQFMNSSQCLIPYGRSDTTTSRSKQDQLLWCILNLIRNTAFVVIVEAPWACYCCIALDSFSSPFLQNITCFDTCARGMPIKKM